MDQETSRDRAGAGLLERLDSIPRNSCQGGKPDAIDASDCEDGEYKVCKMSTLPLAI